jgi:hypothetical protein
VELDLQADVWGIEGKTEARELLVGPPDWPVQNVTEEDREITPLSCFPRYNCHKDVR